MSKYLLNKFLFTIDRDPDFSPAVYGASVVHFPKTVKRRIVRGVPEFAFEKLNAPSSSVRVTSGKMTSEN